MGRGLQMLLEVKDLVCKYGAATALKGVSLEVDEREIVALVGRGLTNREIATQLFIGVRTVESHLRRSFEKLQVTSRAEAGRMARAAEYRPASPDTE